MRDERYGSRNDAQEFRRRMADTGREFAPGRGQDGRDVYYRESRSYDRGYREGRRINNGRMQQHRYTAKKGVAYRAREKAQKRAFKTKLKIGTLLLAAGIGIGGLTYANSQPEMPENTVTQLQEMGYDSQAMWLTQETMEKMEMYDDFFERYSNADKGELTITDNEIIEKLHDIEALNTRIIQEKMARLESVPIKDVNISHGVDGNIGRHIAIRIDKNGDEVVYNNNGGILLGLGKHNNVPEEIVNLIFQLDSYAGLEEELKTDSISKYNAIGEMQKLYNNISEFATKTLLKDEKGNISLMGFVTKDNTLENDKEEKEL